MMVYARDRSRKLPKRKPKRAPRYGDGFTGREAPKPWESPDFSKYFVLKNPR